MAHVAPHLYHRSHFPVYHCHSNDSDQNNHHYIPHCGHGLFHFPNTGLAGVDYQYNIIFMTEVSATLGMEIVGIH